MVNYMKIICLKDDNLAEKLYLCTRKRGERLRVGDQRSGMAAHARPLMPASWPSLNRSFVRQKQINNDDYGRKIRQRAAAVCVRL